MVDPNPPAFKRAPDEEKTIHHRKPCLCPTSILAVRHRLRYRSNSSNQPRPICLPQLALTKGDNDQRQRTPTITTAPAPPHRRHCLNLEGISNSDGENPSEVAVEVLLAKPMTTSITTILPLQRTILRRRQRPLPPDPRQTVTNAAVRTNGGDDDRPNRLNPTTTPSAVSTTFSNLSSTPSNSPCRRD